MNSFSRNRIVVRNSVAVCIAFICKEMISTNGLI